MQDTPRVTLQDMLAARERRAARQRALIGAHAAPVLCLTLNIPGDTKRGALFDRGFALARALVARQLAAAGLRCLRWEEHHPATGAEGYAVVPSDAETLKRAMADIEDAAPGGRLFDLDVLDAQGAHVTRAQLGMAPRACLMCAQPAHACARSRAHTPEALLARARDIMARALDSWDARRIAQEAVRALLCEACCTPKPGLVDCRNAGSHRDMDLMTFMASASALWPYFEACAAEGLTRATCPRDTLAALRAPGRLAEGAMRAATGGVNTHKGAVFTLGILCAAAGRVPPPDRAVPDRVLDEAAAMASGAVREGLAGVTPGNARTAGERLYAAHGVTGARGEAEAGLPAVRAHGLPALERALRAGRSLNDAGVAALLHLIAHTGDTNLIARGGMAAQRAAAAQAAALIADGAFPDLDAVSDMDRAFIARGLSPGGCADLLAACYFLHFLRDDPLEAAPDV